MNRKEMQQWLEQFPEETIIEVVVHRSGMGYYDQGGHATVEEFDPLVDSLGYNVNGHFYLNGNNLMLGGHNE